MIESMLEWTPTQVRMLQVLRDGRQHRKEELHACLNDDMGPLTNIRAHITAINEKLRKYEQTILCVQINGNSVRYQWVRLITSSD